MNQYSKVLIIIPAYNEENNIRKTIIDIQKNYPEMDYIIINDCSTDNTEFILKQEKYNYINLPVNLGIGGGVQTGYLYARDKGYDIAIQMDGDGQHNAKFIGKLIDPIIDGKADITIGSRYIEKDGFQSSFLRRLGINCLSNLISLCTGLKIKDVTSGFRAVNNKYIQIFSQEYAQDYPEPEAIIMAACHGAHFKEVPVIMNEREFGTSSISGIKSIYYMVKVSLSIILLKIMLGRRKYEY
nr:glycosyltransferase family 2 protein [uncultured Clostridium sp.]